MGGKGEANTSHCLALSSLSSVVLIRECPVFSENSCPFNRASNGQEAAPQATSGEGIAAATPASSAGCFCVQAGATGVHSTKPLIVDQNR